MLARPYEPPPDYPMVEDRWANNSINNQRAHPQSQSVTVIVNHSNNQPRSHSIDSVGCVSRSHYFQSHPSQHQQKKSSRYSSPLRLNHHEFLHFSEPVVKQSPRGQRINEEMLRTRQYPEIAGLYCDEQPSLRRFTRYNQSMKTGGMNSHMMMMNPTLINEKLIPIQTTKTTTSSSSSKNNGSIFSKSSKKPLFFMGNWTFRERNKNSRPSLSEAMRDDHRPQSMNLTDLTRRSKSGDSNRTSIVIGENQMASQFPNGDKTRIPIRIERSSMVSRRKLSASAESQSSPNSSPSSSASNSPEFKTNITVDDTENQVAVLRPKKEDVSNNNINNNNNRCNFQSCVQLRKSCPDLETTTMINMEQHRVSKKRTRRAKEKMNQAAWKRKYVKDWTLDDVLLWLQSSQMDEIASLLIGYDIRGEDLLKWDETTLLQLGVGDESSRKKLIQELQTIIKAGPEIVADEVSTTKNQHKTLFDIVKLTSYDQVLAVETPLTTRDITVTHGRLGCLQITKVNGANLPLNENDCLLEINERSGEQFKSALMLTKLISDSNGTPIRFVVLRRKTDTIVDETIKDTSSSGISSSPQTPTE